MTDNQLDFIGLRLTNDLNVCVKDNGPFVNLVSPQSFVPDQYLYFSINTLKFYRQN